MVLLAYGKTTANKLNKKEQPLNLTIANAASFSSITYNVNSLNMNGILTSLRTPGLKPIKPEGYY
jgi:hypothetical protein